MDLLYRSTRNYGNTATASQAILQGLAEDGGLYVPAELPELELDLEQLATMTYQEIAFLIMKAFLTDFSDAELKQCIHAAYDEKFDTPEIAPLRNTAKGHYLELFHGPTIAFKDMALSILPHLMTTAAKKQNLDKEIVILTATSGDTGKAAMAGFADVPGTKIIVFYPKDGVSTIQEKQMVTQKGDNTFVVAIEDNFDAAQTNVKALFNNKELRKKMSEQGYQFSSANSINIGRLIPQVVYYVYAYSQLVHQKQLQAGDPLNIIVPTGNFGNILAAYYAKRLGLPIAKLVCASNENKVLTDFFHSGTYDKNRSFHVTSSPSMDILVSSNLERLIYHLTGNQAEQTKELMEQLVATGEYAITDEMKAQLDEFYADFADEAATKAEIARVFQETAYTLDPHTAVASAVYQSYLAKTQDNTSALIASTASPYKFPQVVLEALGVDCTKLTDTALLETLSEKSAVPLPEAVKNLLSAPVKHSTVIPSDKMQDCVENILKLNN